MTKEDYIEYIDNDDYALEHEKEMNPKYAKVYRSIFSLSYVLFITVSLTFIYRYYWKPNGTPLKVYLILYGIFVFVFYYWYYHGSMLLAKLIIANSYRL